MENLFAALWFFLPAGFANAIPVFVAKAPYLRDLNMPLDMGKEFNGERIFGDNKTWRGLLAGIIIATIIIALQKYAYSRNVSVAELSWTDYSQAVVWLLGPLLGGGALLADALESFFKRQFKIAPGDSWFPFDQIDYILGGYILALPIIGFNAVHFAWLLCTWFVIHIAFSYVGYLLGLKSKPI